MTENSHSMKVAPHIDLCIDSLSVVVIRLVACYDNDARAL